MIVIKEKHVANMDIKKSKHGFFLLFMIFIFLSVAWAHARGLSNAQQQEVNNYLEQANNYEQEDNYAEASRYFNKAAYIYWVNENYKLAAQYYNRSLQLNQKIGNQNAIKIISSNLGMIYSDLNDFPVSLQYFKMSLEVKQKLGNKKEIAAELLNIGFVLATMERLEESNKNIEEALRLARELSDIKLMKRAYSLLAKNHERLGNANKSFEYFNLYSSLEKHTQKEEIKQTKKETEQKIQHMEGITRQALDEKSKKEIELKATEDSLRKVEAISRERQMQIELLNKQRQLDELRLKEKEARLKNAALTRNFIIGVSLLLGIIAFILYRGYKDKKQANVKLERQNKKISKQKEEIHKKNQSITDSINYARRIQTAIMPDPAMLNMFLPESFIYYKPRDIVSGDFYWFSDINLKSLITRSHSSVSDELDQNKKPETNEFIISVIDCTGHGVPGALMSMVGVNLLHEIVSTGFIQPHSILNSMHKGVYNELRQDSSDTQDGMDMGLCLVNKKERKVTFAGAKNHLVYIKNNELNRVKGDNISIGGHFFNDFGRVYKKHELYPDAPATFYMFSDGFVDQLGGKKGRKFMYPNFNKLLLDIHAEPMFKQPDLLDAALKRWRGTKYPQVDDILIIGFRL